MVPGDAVKFVIVVAFPSPFPPAAKGRKIGVSRRGLVEVWARAGLANMATTSATMPVVASALMLLIPLLIPVVL
jgi:hypothetical protein